MGCPPIMNLAQHTRPIGDKEEMRVMEQPHGERNFQELMNERMVLARLSIEPHQM